MFTLKTAHFWFVSCEFVVMSMLAVGIPLYSFIWFHAPWSLRRRMTWMAGIFSIFHSGSTPFGYNVMSFSSIVAWDECEKFRMFSGHRHKQWSWWWIDTCQSYCYSENSHFQCAPNICSCRFSINFEMLVRKGNSLTGSLFLSHELSYSTFRKLITQKTTSATITQQWLVSISNGVLSFWMRNSFLHRIFLLLFLFLLRSNSSIIPVISYAKCDGSHVSRAKSCHNSRRYHTHTYIRPFAQLCHSVEFEGCRVLYNWAQWSFFQSWTFQARECVEKSTFIKLEEHTNQTTILFSRIQKFPSQFYFQVENSKLALFCCSNKMKKKVDKEGNGGAAANVQITFHFHWLIYLIFLNFSNEQQRNINRRRISRETLSENLPPGIPTLVNLSVSQRRSSNKL